MAEGEIYMRKGIHPESKIVTFTCACGAKFEAESTNNNTVVEVCSECHPFYTGKQGVASRTGVVEKFNKKYGFTTKEN